MATALNVPQGVQEALGKFVEDARGAFGAGLESVVLFGSAAEGRLRVTSDVNVILVLARFDEKAIDSFRPSLRFAEASIRLRAMFLLPAEIPAAAQAFAQKFGDISRRHVVLFGSDPFAHLTIPRAAAVARLRQVSLNLGLRLRESYASHGDDEQLTKVAIAESIGPLRVCAAGLLELEGLGTMPGKEAMRKLVEDSGNAQWNALPEQLSTIREGHSTGENPVRVLLQVIEIALYIHARSEKLV
jgi:predicted nucleotidyltransferase